MVGGDEPVCAANFSNAVDHAMESLLLIAGDVCQGLEDVRPSLSTEQLEQINDFLLRKNGLIHQLLRSRVGAQLMPTNWSLEDSCRHLLNRLLADVRLPASRASFMVRALSLVYADTGVGGGRFVKHLWDIVALKAEERSDGLGRVVLRAGIESLMLVGEGTQLRLQPETLKVLMDLGVASLRSSGSNFNTIDHRLVIGLGVEAETGVVAPSSAGLLLGIDAAAIVLNMSQQDEGAAGQSAQQGQHSRQKDAAAIFRREIHAEVIRLLRFCRREEVRKCVVQTLVYPLYHGWDEIDVLKDVWGFIASANRETVELHAGLMCILAEDLMRVLALPARQSNELWDFIYLAISNSSGLCRRRGLHVLHKILMWANQLANRSDYAHNHGDSRVESSQESPTSFRTTDDVVHTHGILSRESVLLWADYVRVLQVLEVETEIHLLDQVIPTVTRLCCKAYRQHPGVGTPPLPTEFRWLGIILSAMLNGGTVARRRSLIDRLVRGELGLGERVGSEAEGRCSGNDDGSLSLVQETWMANVLLPALDHVGWDSSSGRNLHVFSRSVTDFVRCYLRSLSIARVANFLALLLNGVKERRIGSSGALSAVLAAFDLGGKRVPAMGRDILFQLKDTLLPILPPLNQAKRICLLDGIVRILEAYTDYEQMALFTTEHGDKMEQYERVNLVMSVLSAIPEDLAKDRYLSQLAGWVAGLSSSDAQTIAVKPTKEHTPWLGLFRRRLENYLHTGGRLPANLLNPTEEGSSHSPGTIGGEGRNLCLLGLIITESFVLREDRELVLSEGLSPAVKVLQKCWHEPYVAEQTVHAALVFFACWTAVSDVTMDTTPWRWGPLRLCADEVVTLVATRLKTLIDVASKTRQRNESDDGFVTGRDARVLLNALSTATVGVANPPSSLNSQPHVLGGNSHPAVNSLRDQCVLLLKRCPEVSVPPTAHLLAVASLEIILRAQNSFQLDEHHSELGRNDVLGSTPRYTSEAFPSSSAADVVLSLLQNKLEGRIICHSGAHGSDPEWEQLLKEHELQKWSCLNMLLPEVLLEAKRAGAVTRTTSAGEVCHTLVDGLRACLREEMPMAMACFRTVLPCYMHSLPRGERMSEFKRVFELVWSVFKEVRRPQVLLIRDLIAGVLHPAHLAMPELSGDLLSAPQGQLPPLVSAFNAILEFGSVNKPNILRELIGRLTALWRKTPGNAIHFIPGIVELLLFKEWGRGIEKISNDEPRSATEAPRFMLLLFIETWLIPSAAEGDQDSRRVLRALTCELMELQNSKEFRQCSITDAVTYGRKLRAWQALCILCGYLCQLGSSAEDNYIYEIIRPVSVWFWAVHRRTSLPPVRHHMEVFAARMCMAFPDVFLPSVTKELADFRLPGQVLCSLLIVAGHTLIGKERVLTSTQKLSLFKGCLPWMVGTHVMGRMIAQLVCHTVLPEVVTDAGVSHLDGLFGFIRDNPDMVKMRQRQLDAFSQTDCVAMCTVLGMLEAHCLGSNGEIKPRHMCEILQEVMDSIWNETTRDRERTLEEGREWHQTMAEVRMGTWFEQDPEPLRNTGSHIQQKILPWDKLDLAVELGSAASLEQSTAAGKKRQPAVMCATLVDKVPNLAGLARTCEIFAALSLVVPDARLVKHPSFSKISTGAEQWLPIEEVGEKRLLSWLRRAKRQGYALVGIEQTNNSVCLTKMTFPEKVVLVLGREHTGLPLDIINEMDCCCQIPQQGVLRSLNAHVSGALVLWEYTRQMLGSACGK